MNRARNMKRRQGKNALMGVRRGGGLHAANVRAPGSQCSRFKWLKKKSAVGRMPHTFGPKL